MATLGILLFHITFSIVVLLTPGRRNPGTLGSLYERLILLGPFFMESKIRSSPHVYFSYKVNGNWSAVFDHGLQESLFYRAHPWRYDRLHGGDFERYIAQQLGEQARNKKFEAIKDTRGFRELNQFILNEGIGKPVDSIALTYGHNAYLWETSATQFDTIFSYIYNPGTIGVAKKP